jgi:hypothetical protein
MFHSSYKTDEERKAAQAKMHHNTMVLKYATQGLALVTTAIGLTLAGIKLKDTLKS